MKTILKITALSAVLLMLVGGLKSCVEPLNEINPLEMGLFIEVEPFVAPEEMRGTEIHILDKERLAIIKRFDGIESSRNEFTYEILENTIRLIHTHPVYGGAETVLYFRIINSRKFEIEYLHVRPGPRPRPNMTFEKQKVTYH